MVDAKKEYLGIVCKIYLIVLLAAVPLYLPDGYYMQGDTKYFLFRNCSVLCLGIWLVTEVISLLQKRCSKEKPGRNLSTGRGRIKSGCRPSLVDIFVLSYGGCVLLSAFCSDFDAAWSGYADWHMGAVSQLFFVGIYFFVSRYFAYDRLSIRAAEGVFGVIVGIGLLGKLGVDVLGVYQGLDYTDWGRSNLISTIGNINWFCGYCSVALALPVAGYMYGGRKLKTGVLYVISVSGLTLLVIQGSDSGPVLAAAAIGCCLAAGIKKTKWFGKALLLLAGASVGVYLMGLGIAMADSRYAIPLESWIYQKTSWAGWLVLGGMALLLSLGCRSMERRGYGAVLHRWIKIVLGTAGLTVGTIGVLAFVQWRQGNPETWGSGRGILWGLAWEGFQQADTVGKLIGAGPDCFAEYLHSLGRSTVITSEGYWADAVFVNAHNEWLNHLVNIGILGMGCYAGIFISAARRYRGMLLGILVLTMYGIHSLVSFQQVLNTPLLFAVLGLCEATVRSAKR